MTSTSPSPAITHITTTTTTTVRNATANIGNPKDDTTVVLDCNSNTNDSEVQNLKKKLKHKKRDSCLPTTPHRCTLATTSPTPANTKFNCLNSENSDTRLVFRGVPVERVHPHTGLRTVDR